MRFAATAVSLFFAVWTAGCGRGKPVVVGGRADTEQLVLSEIVAQQIERQTRLPVERRVGFTATSQTAEALAGGQVDLYVEYTGSAMINSLRLQPVEGAAAVREQVRNEYRQKLRVEMLDPLGFDARPTLFTRASNVKDTDLARIRQLQEIESIRWRLGFTYDFLERPDGLRLLNRNYTIPLEGAARTFDPKLLGQALAHDEINLMAAPQSHGVLAEPGIVALEDDKHCFPPYEAAILVRRDALENNKSLGDALRRLSGKLTLETMRRLNHAVEFEKKPAADVARAFLARL